MATKTVKMNGWPAGVNNIAPDSALPTDKYGKVIALRDGVNIDVLTSGKTRRRRGIRQVISDPGAHSVYSDGNQMVWATSTTLKVGLPGVSQKTLLTSSKLAKPISYVTVNGRTYFSNEDINGIINADGSYEPWGIIPPSAAPALNAIPGDRKYQVTCTFVTASGEESGAPIGSQVLCDDIPNIQVYGIPQSSDPRVVATRLYVTNIDGKQFYRALDVPAGITIATLRGFFASGSALKTQFMEPPPPGQLLEYNNGRIYVATGPNVVYTEPLRYGVCDPANNFLMYSERITLLKAVPDGIYISSDQIYYIANAGTDDVDQVETTIGRAIEGVACELPNSEDIMFVTDRGFMRATLGGQVTNLTEEQISLDFYSHGALGYVEHDGHKSVVALLGEGRPNPAVAKDFRDGDLARKNDYM